MFIIVFEVQNYKILLSQKPEKMNNFLHELTSTIGYAASQETDNFLLFTFSCEIDEMAETINKLSKIVFEGTFLHTVNMFIDIANEIEAPDLTAYMRLFRMYSGLNQTCVGPDFARRIQEANLGECTPIDEHSIWRLSSLKALKKVRRTKQVSGYGKAMEHVFSRLENEALYIETSNERESWLLSETVTDSITLAFTGNSIAVYKPFLRFHSPISANDVYENLHPEDQAVILRTAGLQDRSEYTWSHSEVFLRMSALLKGFSEYFASNGKSPKLQIVNAHLMDEAQMKLLIQLWQQKDVTGSYRLVLYGNPDANNDAAKRLSAVTVNEEFDLPDLDLPGWLTIHGEEFYRSIVYGCIDMQGIMTTTDIVRALAKILDKPMRDIQAVIQSLRDEKVFFGRQYLEIPDKGVLLEQKSDLFLKREILSVVSDMVLTGHRTSAVSFEVLKTCMYWNPQQLSVSDFLTVSLHLLRYRKYIQLELLFDYLYNSSAMFPQLDLLNDFVCLKKHMARNELHEAEKVFKKLVFFDDIQSVLYPHIRLAIGEYYYCGGKYQESLNAAKKLVFYTQDNEVSEMEAPAHMLIGHAMLKLGKNNEAIEYFGIAVEEAKNSMYPGDYTHALISKSISLFIRGNYSMAIRNIEAAYASSETEGFVDLKIFCKFLCARCNFIVGMYEDALLMLQEALVESSLNQFPNWELMLKTWMGRCYGYMGHFDRAFATLEALPQTTESLFFLAECHYFFDHIKEARTLVQKALEHCEELLPDPNQYLLLDPRHGLYDIEGRAFSNPHLVLLRLILSFWGYLENYSESNQQALEIFDELLKSENLSDNDPYVFFYYLCYGLTDKLKNHVDVLEYLTVLSKGIRHIQGIAARIDDVDKRLSYLNRAYWTKKMIDAGKAHKLT